MRITLYYSTTSENSNNRLLFCCVVVVISHLYLPWHDRQRGFISSDYTTIKIYFKIKSMARIYIVIDIFLNLPQHILSST